MCNFEIISLAIPKQSYLVRITQVLPDNRNAKWVVRAHKEAPINYFLLYFKALALSINCVRSQLGHESA